MRTSRILLLGLSTLVLVATLAAARLSSAPTPEVDQRGAAQKEMQNGNYLDAYNSFRALALSLDTDPKLVGQDLNNAIQCLNNLNRVHEIGSFLEAVIEAHSENWRLLRQAAQNYLGVQHGGYIVAGEFHRGQHRGGGKVVNAIARDRIRALQLMVQARPFVDEEPPSADVAYFYTELARTLLTSRGNQMAWQLQFLSDISELPDYEDGWGHYYGGTAGAPVDADGQPVLHGVPDSWEDAKTDGERWRWAQRRVVEVAPQRLNQVRFEFAGFLQRQFGVQTMQQYSHFFYGRTVDDTKKDESGTYDLHTLGESETIARLATGIKRFDLPEEFNFIRIYQEIVEDDDTGYADNAIRQLAQTFENRRQYSKAADYWRQSIAKFGNQDWKRQRLRQIVGHWGRFETTMSQPAGSGAKIDYRFRNGVNVTFEAHRIKFRELLTDVKDYLKSNPGRLNWQSLNIANIGYRLVHADERKYLGERVAKWDLPLDPLKDHFDKRITVRTPLQEAGAYLLTATMNGGNTTKIVVWLSDTTIVKKPLDDGAYYFVADAVTGQPVEDADVELFGYRQEHIRKNRYRVYTIKSDEMTDENGQMFQSAKGWKHSYQWVATATTRDGRFAYLGFTNVWHHGYREWDYNQTKVFSITDRPVYRPEQPVKYKFWVRHTQYDKEDTSQYANASFRVQIYNPKNEKVHDEQVKADEYGGLDGEYSLPADATLGVYRMQVAGYSQAGHFRVEEYKKPEFEVTVEAPEKPVELGEKITSTIRAKYYFGSPVTQAKVKYKVMRSRHTDQWYPTGAWDWFYGPGYWWYAYDYAWYPGWHEWGCRRPTPWWAWSQPTPPEIVAELETEIGPDGTVQVDIDTAIARAIHPDQDHSYEIIAEVVDASRRTIVGRGKVLVARRPFKVFSWVDRGYYRVGDTVRASFSARTLDQKPVAGKGQARLLKITYNADGKPVETPVLTEDLDTDAQGEARTQIKAKEKGQYRLAYKVTDASGHTVEGGYVFTIIGDGFDGAGFRFNDVELLTDKREYKPGETVKLQVNANRVGGTVLLFVRPSNGVYLPPKVLRLDGKSTVVDLLVAKKDMPNFYVEALTISGGKVHSETREIHVPPEKRVLGVEVLPSHTEYKPGEGATVKVKLTDSDGEPFVGSTVVAIYDKSVEAIAGGSNVQEIKAFFWKWRRQHQQATETSLHRFFANLTLPKKAPMSNLGVFGDSVADQFGNRELKKGKSAGLRAQAAGEVQEGLAMDSLSAAPGAPAGRRDEEAGKDDATGAGGATPFVKPTVRSEFADTALWAASLVTDSSGVAEVSLTMPENLTAWKVRVWGMGHGTKVGEGEVEVVTRKNLIVRLQAPRFFVQKDEVVLSANVHNYLSSDKRCKVSLELDGDTLKPLDELVKTIEVTADGEARVDWRVKVIDEGEAVVRMLALTDEESDAMEMRFPVYVHGMLKMDSISGAIRSDEKQGQFEIRVPEERRIEESRLEVRYSPTLAGAMVDALPYLVDYPYGCTEQTLNRFLPTVITQKILLDMGLDLESIREKRTNLNAQEIGDDRERAGGWTRLGRNPVFDEDEVSRMVRAGVKRLAEMQLSDGGWGWFSGWKEISYPHTTAVVVHGLQIAVENDVAVDPGIIARGVQWLKAYQDDQTRELQHTKEWNRKSHANNIDALVYMVLVDANVKNDAMKEFLYRDRTKLAVYSLAMLGLALEQQDDGDKLAMILRNIEQFLVQDEENQTAYLNLPGGYWWYWYGSENEAHAYYLKLLSRTDPKGRTASRLVKYLLNNRKHATYWNSTRDTALCIEAMADYLRASGEDQPDMTVEVWLDGRKHKEVRITGENLFSFDNKFVLYGDAVESGTHSVELKRQGTGPLYYNAYLTNFTLEDYISRAGLELKVERKFYRLLSVDKEIKAAGSRGQVVDQKVEKYRRVEIDNLATLKSGDLVEVELVIDSKNDYEYIIFEDMKAAGFEAVEMRSGYNGNALGAYMEFRDNRVSLFVRALARGRHSVAYRLRAEIPGKFSALPTRAYAMYAPELKGNSDEIKLIVED